MIKLAVVPIYILLLLVLNKPERSVYPDIEMSRDNQEGLFFAIILSCCFFTIRSPALF